VVKAGNEKNAEDDGTKYLANPDQKHSPSSVLARQEE
jgi:hypothetical protein